MSHKEMCKKNLVPIKYIYATLKTQCIFRGVPPRSSDKFMATDTELVGAEVGNPDEVDVEDPQ